MNMSVSSGTYVSYEDKNKKDKTEEEPVILKGDMPKETGATKPKDFPESDDVEITAKTGGDKTIPAGVMSAATATKKMAESPGGDTREPVVGSTVGDAAVMEKSEKEMKSGHKMGGKKDKPELELADTSLGKVLEDMGMDLSEIGQDDMATLKGLGNVIESLAPGAKTSVYKGIDMATDIVPVTFAAQLMTDDGMPVMSLAKNDGILMDNTLISNRPLLKNALVEGLADFAYQFAFGEPSKGNFGAEVAAVLGGKELTEEEKEEFRAMDDTVMVTYGLMDTEAEGEAGPTDDSAQISYKYAKKNPEVDQSRLPMQAKSDGEKTVSEEPVGETGGSGETEKEDPGEQTDTGGKTEKAKKEDQGEQTDTGGETVGSGETEKEDPGEGSDTGGETVGSGETEKEEQSKESDTGGETVGSGETEKTDNDEDVLVAVEGDY